MDNESVPAAGWYLDPDNTSQQRWWDGVQWTEHVASRLQEPQAQRPAAATFVSAHPTGEQAVGAEKATTALVLAILGLLCCGPLSIVALVMSSNARGEARRSGRPLDSKMNTARVISIIGVALWAAGIALRANGTI